RSLEKKYGAAKMVKNDTIDFTVRHDFRSLGGGGPNTGSAQGKEVVVPDAAGSERATYVFSDKLPGTGAKRYEYALREPAKGSGAIPLMEKTYQGFFLLHSKRSRNRAAADKTWALLQPIAEGGGRVPVFYVGDLKKQDPKTFAFGLTRLFKVPHMFSVGEVLDRQPLHKLRVVKASGGGISVAVDFVENLFGYVFEKEDLADAGVDTTGPVPPPSVARKGRVAFSFARLSLGQQAGTTEPFETVMMAPRASYAPFYLVGRHKDYSDGSSRIAGRKRYLPRYPGADRAGALAGLGHRLSAQITPIRQAQGGRDPSRDTISRLKFLVPRSGKEIRFSSTIRLHNVTAAELGAVLWVLTHGGDPRKPYRHMIGRAKPFGAGQLRVVSAQLVVTPNDAGPSVLVRGPMPEEIGPDGTEGFYPRLAMPAAPEENASHRLFLDAFGEYMRRQDGLRAWPDTQPIREFLGALRAEIGDRLAKAGRLEYLPLRQPHLPRGSGEAPFNDIRKMTKPFPPGREGNPPIGSERYLRAPEE
ncbi:MAG: hypothetical protein ACREC6_02825, partial [Hyphomicrobiaceae bacterium]